MTTPMNDLQRLTEQLGERLGRSVAIDDPSMKLQAYSPQNGAVDEQRVASILHRQGDPEAVEWAMAQGIQRAVGWTRVPPNPDKGMLSRICAPVRHNGVLLGYLWLIDAEESISGAELDVVHAAVDQAAAIMHREQLISDLRAAQERELLRDLVNEDVQVRGQAMSGLAEESLFDLHRPAQALVLDTSTVVEGVDRITVAESALSRIRLQLPPRTSLHLVRPDHSLLVVALDSHTRVLDIASRVLREYRVHLPDGDTPVCIGVGTVCNSVVDLPISYQRAKVATQVGRVLGLERAIEWTDLGIYRLLSILPLETIADDVLHPALPRIADHPGGEQLLHDLEVFLDEAGDVTSAAALLYVHRATLYQRLAKIERIGDVELKSGSDRLDLHLSLKLARLRGILPPASGRRPDPKLS